MRHHTLLFAATALLAADVHAQSNVRAWNAAGQVFVVWELAQQTALSYSVHVSPGVVSSTADAARVGQLFEPEWSGARLRLANPNARWKVPDGNGGTYTLTANEGLFVFTPHDTATRYFSVTRDSETAITTAQRTAQALAIAYDPVAEPVKCHLQLAGTTGQGFPYQVYALWVDGRNDPQDARPDIPIMANAAKNGAPHVFAVYSPQGGPPAGPYPAVVCLHGGGPQGSYWSYAPNSFHYGNTGNAPVDGITIAFDDRLFIANNGVVNLDRPSNWFGWHTQMSATAAGNAPANGVVVPYTLRRLVWTLDWLTASSPFDIDPARIAVQGNSMGGTGTLLLSRWKPERFSTASAFVPPHYTPETGGRLFGNTASNLRTTELGPDGDTLRVNDFFDPAVRLSPTTRDRCLTRIYRGRCDDAAEWGAEHLQLYNALNSSGLGIHLYWDQRDHTASDWDTDDPATTCADIGQWVVPDLTERCAVAFQGRFRSDVSYPGFYNDDQDATLPGRQPELGNGDITDGAPWGAWAGFYDWETNTITDDADRWECTVFLVGASSAPVDVYAGDSATCDVTIRKPQLFQPATGTPLDWRLERVSDGQVLQSGTTSPDADGVVAVTGLTLFKDPVRTRLIVEMALSTGLGDRTAGSGLIVHPNPADQVVRISGGAEGELTYTVVSTSGAMVAHGRTMGRMLPTEQLRPGTYALILDDASSRRFTQRLTIIR